MPKVHKQVKEPATNTSAPTADTSEPNKTNGSANASTSVERIPWNDAVPEGKEIVAKIVAAERDIERYQWRLGELAAKVETKYDDRTLAKFAKEIGIETSTLNHYRTVYRKWEGKLPPEDKLPPGAKLPSFTVLKELATVEERAELIEAEPKMSKRRAEVHKVLKDHPKREEIRRKYPDLTCTRQARDIMRSYDEGGAGNGKGKDYKRWFDALVKRCNEDTDEAAIVDQPMDLGQLRDLLGGIEPDLLDTVKEAGEAWLKLYDFLFKLCEEGPQAVLAEREERERRAKAHASDLAKRKRQKAPTAQAAPTAQVAVGA
jgi:hypothetical protein